MKSGTFKVSEGYDTLKNKWCASVQYRVGGRVPEPIQGYVIWGAGVALYTFSTHLGCSMATKYLTDSKAGAHKKISVCLHVGLGLSGAMTTTPSSL